MLTFTIQKNEGEPTLISFIKKRFATTPLSLIYKLFRTKKIKVNGKIVRYYHYRLKLGDNINIYDNSLTISEPNFNCFPPQFSRKFVVIYEDKNLLLVDKIHGVSMPELDKSVQYYFYQQNPL